MFENTYLAHFFGVVMCCLKNLDIQSKFITAQV